MSEEIKYFEVRDRMTFIPVMAIRVDPGSMERDWLLRKAGFRGRAYLFLIHLTTWQAEYEFSHWNNITMRGAHQEIDLHFGKYQSGAVIDMEYIRGETSEPVPSERYYL